MSLWPLSTTVQLFIKIKRLQKSVPQWLNKIERNISLWHLMTYFFTMELLWHAFMASQFLFTSIHLAATYIWSQLQVRWNVLQEYSSHGSAVVTGFEPSSFQNRSLTTLLPLSAIFFDLLFKIDLTHSCSNHETWNSQENPIWAAFKCIYKPYKPIQNAVRSVLHVPLPIIHSCFVHG